MATIYGLERRLRKMENKGEVLTLADLLMALPTKEEEAKLANGQRVPRIEKANVALYRKRLDPKAIRFIGELAGARH